MKAKGYVSGIRTNILHRGSSIPEHDERLIDARRYLNMFALSEKIDTQLAVRVV